MKLTPVADVLANLSPPAGGPKITPVIFAGESSDTADLKALSIARQMEKDQAAPREIWQETGWYKGLDKEWRYEISDVGSGVKDGKFYHPDLEKAYPSMFKEWNFLVMSAEEDENLAKEPDTYGYTDPATKTIVVRDTLQGEEQRKIFVHEFQHAVQAQEGFTLGGNPNSRETANIAAIRQGKGWLGQLMATFGIGGDQQQNQAVYESYGGEAEARATTARIYMNKEERKNVFPLQSYDVSPQEVLKTEELRK